MSERFVSEALSPVISTCDTARMAGGGPGLPSAFRWRRRTIEVDRVLRSWRETGACHSGSGEAYVRKHWFEFLDRSGARVKVYFERQPRHGQAKRRWWLFSVEDPK